MNARKTVDRVKLGLGKKVTILLITTLLLAACGGGTTEETTEATRPVATATPLVQETIRPLTWVGCGIIRTAFMAELAAAYTEKMGIEIEIQGGGATRGIRDTAALKSDMGGTCRHVLPVPEEENAMLVQVAWDGLVAIVNPDNPVDGITVEQLESILLGEIKNWEELGGPDEKVHLVIRDQGGAEGDTSGVGTMTRELVFFDRDVKYTDDSTAVVSSGPLEEIVEEDTWAVGVTGVSSARRREVKILHLDGVEPSYENIANGAYPLFRPLYLVIPKESPYRGPAEDFITFALSKEGQQVVKQNGTVTLEDGSELWESFRAKMLEAGVSMGDY